MSPVLGIPRYLVLWVYSELKLASTHEANTRAFMKEVGRYTPHCNRTLNQVYEPRKITNRRHFFPYASLVIEPRQASTRPPYPAGCIDPDTSDSHGRAAQTTRGLAPSQSTASGDTARERSNANYDRHKTTSWSPLVETSATAEQRQAHASQV